MIIGEAPRRIYLYAKPVDFRKGHAGLAAIVQEMTKIDVFSGAAFIFRPKSAFAVKILVWDGSGLVLIHKKLEDRNFKWPSISDGVMPLTPVQMAALFDGIDWRKVHTARRTKKPKIAA
ncbi:MAG: IS66 family insertion sequence hypothetical protein [Parvularcula sp.]|nr:IS66 family insertion sequence hypothetical protein [Parvularcula sp.]